MKFVFPKYIISCEEFIEHDDGSLSFIRAFENRTYKELPYEIDFNLIIAIEYSLSRKEERNIFIRIVDPEGGNGSESGMDRNNDMKLILRETKKNELKTLVNIIHVKEMLIDKEGTYSVLVYYDDEIIAKHDILFSKEEVK